VVSVNKSISMKLADAPVFAEFELLAKKEGYHSSSAYIVDLIKREVKEHKDSHNPQTVIDMFDRDIVTAIPNIYERDDKIWLKFYSRLSQKEYDALTERLQIVNSIHNSAKILL